MYKIAWLQVLLAFSCLHQSSAYSLDSTRVSRRSLFGTAAGAAFGIATSVLPAGAGAATGPPTPEELARIKEGYRGIVYLLDNWEDQTTTCRENGGECKRDAEPVRRALGLRSTTDPLFQIDKLFSRVKYMDLDIDKLEAFFEASEDWNSAMNMSNSMAFISQFGVGYAFALIVSC